MATRYRARARRPDGTPADGADVHFLPHPREVRIVGGEAIVPRTVTIPTGGDGWFELDLVPGTYEVRIVSADGERYPSFITTADAAPEPGDWLQLEPNGGD